MNYNIPSLFLAMDLLHVISCHLYCRLSNKGIKSPLKITIQLVQKN